PFTGFPGRKWPSILHFWCTRKWENRVLLSARQILVTSESMRSELLRQIPSFDPAQVNLVYNGFPDAMLNSAPASHSPSPILNIIYAGTLHFREPSRREG